MNSVSYYNTRNTGGATFVTSCGKCSTLWVCVRACVRVHNLNKDNLFWPAITHQHRKGYSNKASIACATLLPGTLQTVRMIVHTTDYSYGIGSGALDNVEQKQINSTIITACCGNTRSLRESYVHKMMEQ